MVSALPVAIRRRLAATAVALVVVLGLALATSSEAAVPSSFFGMSAVRATAEDYQRMNETGAGSVRVEVPWRLVQKAEGEPFDFTPVDGRFRNAAAGGLAPMPMLYRAPDFVTSATEIIGPVHTKEQRRGWKDFVAAAAGRYGPGGEFWAENPDLDAKLAPRDWIVWNEQNALVFWDPKPKPTEYARLLRLTRTAVDEAQPSIRLIAGGMYGDPFNDKAIDGAPFLRRLYRQSGIKKAMAGFSVHPYGVNITGVKRQLRDMHDVALAAGQRKARIYVGEIGWASDGFGGVLVKNKAKQAELLDRAYRLFLQRRKGWNIKAAFWFTWRDYNEDSLCHWCRKAGLVNRRGEEKPAAKAYEKLVAEKTAKSG
jgi:hypothetical protein